MIARGSTVLEPHDHVLLMAQADRTSEAYEMLGISDQAAEKAIVLGATRLAQITAALLADNGISTTLIDEDRRRCHLIAERLPRVVTVCGNPTDPKLLMAEGVDAADSVLALSGWDGGRQRLLPCGKVDDAQSSMTQPDVAPPRYAAHCADSGTRRGVQEVARLVGPTMHQGPCHPHDDVGIDRLTVALENPRDPTH